MTIEIVPVEVGGVGPGDALADRITDVRDDDVVVVSAALVVVAEDRAVDEESARVLRRRGDETVVETVHGFVVAGDVAARLPVDPDRSARRIRDGIRGRAGVEAAVVVAARFDRPWRAGRAAVAVGCAGIAPVVDGVCVVDELASAASLAAPVAIVRGVDRSWLRAGSVQEDVVRARAGDLFR